MVNQNIKTQTKRSDSRTVSFYTLGCRLNQSETVTLEHAFTQAGFSVVNFKEPADIAVINTCTVTENGDTDTRRLIHKVGRTNPSVRIALIGCQAQVQKEQLAALPNVRWIVGNAVKMDLAEIISASSEDNTPEVITPTIPRSAFTMPIAGPDKAHTRANLKIQDGCDFFCSFCEIPYARGRARSRVFNDILHEANTLVDSGHQEIVLTGINIGTYTNDRYTFMDVLNAMEQITDLKRIRISSIEPTTIPEALLTKMASDTKICRYLHIPLQSGSDHVLHLMKRKYTFDEVKTFILKAHSMIPDIGMGTDIIVGFPGESEADIQASFDALRELPLDYAHVFSYSQRQYAKSQSLEQAVPVKEIKQRSKMLRDLSSRKRRLFYQSLVGTKQDVLFEQQKNGYWTGVTGHYARVHVPSPDSLSNRFKCVIIQSVQDDVLFGSLA